MKTDDVIGLVILAFLAGSLTTMILFCLMNDRSEKRYRDGKRDG